MQTAAVSKTTQKILNKQIKKQKLKDDFKKRLKLSKAQKQELYQNKQWYTIRALLGNKWANWYILLGAKERGKTFSVQEYVLRCFFNPKHKLYQQPFYWWRLNDKNAATMLMNNAAKMFEPILVRRFHLEKLKVKGDTVYFGDKILCYVWGLSTAYNNKGTAMFDNDKFKGVNIIVDECAFEKGQRKTFDLCYNLKVQVDTVARHRRDNVKVFFMMNNTEECPDILSMFGFIPIEFNIYKLKRKHCVIDYIPNSKAYDKLRKDALSNEIDNGTGNFTNKVVRDLSLLYKGRLYKPSYIVKFSKYTSDWFTIWDDKVICPYNGEKKQTIAMLRYLDNRFDTELRDMIIAREDALSYMYKDVCTQQLWRKDLEMIKAR